MSRIMEDVSKWPVEKRREKIEQVYMERIGRELNLDNPTFFTEKIQWRKLYEDDPLRKLCTDKLTFKQYVREKIGKGYSAELIDVWHRPEDVHISNIPMRCVIKSNCASEGRYCLVIKDKDEINLIEIEEDIKGNWFNRLLLNTNSFNRGYYDMSPSVIVEEYLFDPSEMDEYKFYCFDGEPKYLYRYSNHFQNGKNMYGKYPIGIYTADWEYTDYRIGNFERETKRDKPDCFDEMTRISRLLSEDFSFVRVDFFVTRNSLYVAELAFCPFAGLEPYYPEGFDLTLGNLWTFPPQSNKLTNSKGKKR